jgi:dipeptidyl aminopeptidase/acylaminoacyl peptidase
MDKTRENSTAIDVFTVIAMLLIIGIPIYGYFKLKPDKIFNIDDKTEETEQNFNDSTSVNEEINEEVEEEKKPIEITGYAEELVEIEGQWAYIAVPKPIDPNNLPRLVIYNHGTESRVEEDLDTDFKHDLTVYSKLLTPHNYIFAVSNAHGFDLDTPEAINDNYNLYMYIKEKYGIQNQLYLFAYSKGGVTALNFTDKYPNLVSKIGMLAPRMRLYEWDRQRAQNLQEIEIKVWHGTNDVNVAYVDSIDFVEQMDKWGVEIDLIPLQGKTHWSINPEYFSNIVEFFNSSENSPE